jgi:hypothetical protein
MQIGIGVNLDKGVAQYALVKELGVQHLIIRMPLWEMEKIDEYVAFAKFFFKCFICNDIRLIRMAIPFKNIIHIM